MDKLINKIKEKNKNFYNIFNINPHKHWHYMLYISIIIIIVLIFFSFFLFYKIKTEKIFKVENIEPNKKIILKEKLLNEIVNSFNQKADNLEKLKNGGIILKDPS